MISLALWVFAAASPSPPREPFTERLSVQTRLALNGPVGLVGASLAYYPIRYAGLELGVGLPARQHLSLRLRAPAGTNVAIGFGAGLAQGELRQSDENCIVSPLYIMPAGCGNRTYAMSWAHAWLMTSDLCFEIISGAHVVTRLCGGVTYLLTPDADVCESRCAQLSGSPCVPRCPPASKIRGYAELAIGYAF